MPKILKFSQVQFDDSKKININVLPSVKAEEDSLSHDEIEDSAESLIEQAKKQADEILSEASLIAEKTYKELEEAVEKAKKEASEQGRKSGYMDGYNEGMATTAELRNKTEQAYNNALAERIELLNTVEPQIVELIIGILNKLIPNVVMVNPQVIMYLIKRGLSDSTVSGNYKVFVSQDDYEFVMESKNELSNLVDGSSQIDIFADSSLKKSDCIIETPFGNIDCGLTQQYNSLIKNINYIFNNR